jgi:hypothetical protein
MEGNTPAVGFANGAPDLFVGEFAPFSSRSLVNSPQIRTRGFLEQVSFYRFHCHETCARRQRGRLTGLPNVGMPR